MKTIADKIKSMELGHQVTVSDSEYDQIIEATSDHKYSLKLASLPAKESGFWLAFFKNIEPIKPIGADSSGLLRVFKIDHDIDDSVLYSFNGGPVTRAKIDYNIPNDEDLMDSEPSTGFKVGSLIYLFDDIMRLTNDWTSDEWSQWKTEIDAYESDEA